MPKELVATAPGKLTLREYRERPPDTGEILIKSYFSAEKHGTTFPFFKGNTPFTEKRWDDKLQLFVPREGKESPSFPMRLGNITVGEVVETGERVESFQRGDRVWGYLPIRETHTVKEERVHAVPSGLTDEDLVCIDPAVVALLSVREARFSLGDKLAVFGLGAIGLFVVQMAKVSGATFVVAVDLIQERRNIAEKFGAGLTIDPKQEDTGLAIKYATEGQGVDVAIEASGSYRALQEAMRGTRFGGTIVPTSFYHGQAKDLNLAEEWHFNRYTMVSGARVESEPYRDYPRWDRERVYRTAIELFQKKLISSANLLHIVDFENILDAYHALKENPNRWIKLGITYKGERK